MSYTEVRKVNQRKGITAKNASIVSPISTKFFDDISVVKLNIIYTYRKSTAAQHNKPVIKRWMALEKPIKMRLVMTFQRHAIFYFSKVPVINRDEKNKLECFFLNCRI